jgi:YfiH family protein
MPSAMKTLHHDLYITTRETGNVTRDVPAYLARLEHAVELRAGETVAWMNQVHGKAIRYIPSDHPHQTSVKEVDGMWTDQEGVVLVAKTADCGPLFLWNRKAGIVAALHCGWRGFFAGIIEDFAVMCTVRGLSMEDFEAHLGPMLQEPNFEVQDDFVVQIPTTKLRFLRETDGRKTYDLAAGICAVLAELGVLHLGNSGTDTYSSDTHYSFRKWTQTPETERSDQYQIFASAIVLRSS